MSPCKWVKIIHPFQISIHSSQAGWAFVIHEVIKQTDLFQSTHPKRDEPIKIKIILNFIQFQSTHPKRDEPIKIKIILNFIQFQSTHPKRDEPL